MTEVRAPAHFARHPQPHHPRDLVSHERLNWHPSAEGSLVNIRLARAGPRPGVRVQGPSTRAGRPGEPVPVLEEFCEPFPGYYLMIIITSTLPHRHAGLAPLPLSVARYRFHHGRHPRKL
jgi:hypothetical protein